MDLKTVIKNTITATLMIRTANGQKSGGTAAAWASIGITAWIKCAVTPTEKPRQVKNGGGSREHPLPVAALIRAWLFFAARPAS